tara:strand:- start:1257 stop:1436 length:180 start_codon:yes stop_codon:yes gene_type:complete
MKVDFEIDTVQVRSGEIRKSLSVYNDPASIAVKLLLIKSEVENLNDVQRLFNQFSVIDE